MVVLISGAGSNMAALMEAAKDPDYGVEIVAVGTDREGTRGIEVAREAGVPTFVVPFRAYADRAEWDTAMSDRIAEYTPDLVVSAGFMRILGPAVVGRHQAVNIHPALLPSFPGAHAVRDALAHGVRITGTTIHFLDEGVDSGPIIDQVAVPVEDGDDESGLHERIKVVERRMLVDTVGRLAREGWTVDGRHVRFGRTDTKENR
ncbi:MULTISPECIES: phosphoribosylglycinamide formyltransferase [Nocardiopsis]|uniref:Phosphoribosylglycinamide formyltransferase n=1 Tax=Nocardiopsis alba TaxID=53437 RepID=A0A7K2IQB6_9ACTN|nr:MULTISPECIES: phosphoribosylglycinamide formyltransferase [Nocardiopsis]MEC3892918.1 phosphoribosylglycinamide formyltransferase [Nocardiopsis sp. LDBS1602]MYR32170.1 phosphoribosylglycinamide formyltransferase [Nocardiopsis alba]